MDEAKLHEFLSLLGVGSGITRDRWVSASCPFAFAKHRGGKDTNPSFGVTIEPEKASMFNCFSCHSKGPLDSLLHELAFLSKGVDHPQVKQMRLADAFAMLEQETDEAYYGSDAWLKSADVSKAYQPFDDGMLEYFKTALEVPRALDYLRSRGVSKTAAFQANVMYDRAADRIAVPWYARDGSLAGIRGRSIEGKQYYDYRCHGVSNVGQVWMSEYGLDASKPIVVVEGMFDWFAVRRLYPNVVANLSTAVSPVKRTKLIYYPQVLVFFDHDEGGLGGSQTLLEALRGRVPARALEYPQEALESGHTDPGSMDDSELAAALESID